MLKRRFRMVVTQNAQLQYAVVSPLFTLKYGSNNLSYGRFGFVVSKKIDKRATRRNAVKRMFSLCIKNLQATIKPGTDFLFIPKKEATAKTPIELDVAIKKALAEKDLLI